MQARYKGPGCKSVLLVIQSLYKICIRRFGLVDMVSVGAIGNVKYVYLATLVVQVYSIVNNNPC